MNKKVLGVLVVLVMTALACTCSNLIPGGGGGGAAPTEPPPPPEDILWQDDFGDSGSGWEIGEYDDGHVGYKDGDYFVTSVNTEIGMWGVAGRSFDNVIIEVDATQVSAGPNSDNAYGVVCREQEGSGHGYYLRISGDGYYSIAKAANEEFTALIDWTESDAIKKGNATNHIEAICNGSTLELFVNGERLGSVEDSTFTSGDIAFTATTYEEEMTEAHFDNLVVRKP
jgi:hypothetical protein